MAEMSTDVRRGHCYVKSDEGYTIAQLVDLGGRCAIQTEGDLNPEEARLLGHALITWSAWRRHVIPRIDHWTNPPTTETNEGAR